MFVRAAATESPAAIASSRSACSFSSASRGLVGQPELKLGVGDPELALVGVADLGAGLEVVGGDAQLLGEHPQRLDRRPAGPASMREM